ncbi:MAG: SphA family protein [Syntrophobacteraceae bacterium]
MRKYIVALMVLCVAVAMTLSTATAEEIWDFHLRGHTEGLSLGAAPPPGVYMIDETFIAPAFKLYGDDGHTIPGPKLFAFVNIPTFVWSTGYKFLGADYMCGFMQPWDYTNLTIQQNTFPTTFEGGSQWGAYNTVLLPAMLSWQLPFNLHGMLGFEVGLNDGTTSPGDRVIAYSVNRVKYANPYQSDGGIYAESSNDTYVFAPLWGLSWLCNGWNVSVFGEYDFSTKDTDTNYQSADEIGMDYTVAYNWRKWTFGFGAESQFQVGNDKFASQVPRAPTGIFSYRSQPGTRAENFTAGPLIGYNFGAVDTMFIYNFPLYTKNDFGGQWFEFRILVPLGNPCDWMK